MINILTNKKAIFFDADGTLVDHKACEKQALQYVFKKLNIQYIESYLKAFREIESNLWQNIKNNKIQNDDIFIKRFEELFTSYSIEYNYFHEANELFKTGLASSSALIDGAEEVISYLYDKNFILCVVTNGLVALQKPRVKNSNIGKYIHHTIVSEEVGVHKPNPLIFNTLIQRLGLYPKNVIMIGDSLNNDIQGAKNAEIESIWYNPENIDNTTDIQPDIIINKLTELILK